MALPGNAQLIVDAIGFNSAMAFIRETGGRHFRFPVGKGSAQWEHLVELVGEKAAEKLIRLFGGTDMYIPCCYRAIKAERNRRLVTRYESLLKQNYSARGAVDILVPEFGISNRMIFIIVNGPAPAQMPEMAEQGQLF